MFLVCCLCVDLGYCVGWLGFYLWFVFWLLVLGCLLVLVLVGVLVLGFIVCCLVVFRLIYFAVELVCFC